MSRALALSLLAALALPAHPAASDDLTLEQVLLTTGGVGYLGYRGTVSAEGDLTLTVPLRQVDDILKSLTILEGGSSVGAVSLLGPTPLADIFRGAPFAEGDLADLPTLLHRLRGSEVEVRGRTTLRGRLLGVAREETVEQETRLVRHRLSLLTEDGIRTAILEQADGVALVDPVLDDQLQLVLSRLADRQLDQERELLIEVGDSAGREVRLGYLAEMPIWKASYRLVTGESEGRLQGWAILENLSGQDWREVAVTLVAGSPTALRQELFQSYFVPRPTVPVVPGPAPSPAPAPMPMGAEMAARSDKAMEPALAAAPASAPQLERAQARELTAQTLFHLADKVTLSAGRTVMAPLVDRGLPVQRVVLYRAQEGDQFAQAALRLRNESEASLPAGLATLYERLPDGALTYLGDAPLPQMAPKAQELLAYGRDAQVEVARREDSSTWVDRARIVDGVLQLSRVVQQRDGYAVTTAFQGADRRLVLEQPLPTDWRLAEPVDAAVDRGIIRLERPLPAASTTDVTLVTERTMLERIELLDADLDQLQLLLAEGAISPELRAAIQRLQDLSARLAEVERRMAASETRRDERVAEQDRLRANLEAVPPNSDLARRYLDRLGTSEDELTALAQELERLRGEREQAQEERRRFLRSLRL